MTDENKEKYDAKNFIEQIIEGDLEEGKYDAIQVRFPPEPNGYLHIGHAKSICLNFGLAQEYGGKCNLRFDDTNPTKEKVDYVDAIKRDIEWLGYRWDALYFASDYFDELYEMAITLIKNGKAYVDDSSAEEIAKMKGTPTQAGVNSPYRDRSITENLDLFERMKQGEFEEGSRVLRAKIDMTSANMHMRDPFLYRIKKAHHHRTGDKWCIYPMYDMAHGQSDAIEQVTHSICTLEFIPHRELYEWLIEQLGLFPSRQYEMARLNLNYTVMSKRKLLKLVEDGIVVGWDDPRMPTISGLRRRGYTPSSIRNFADRVGVAKRDNVIDLSLLEFFIREELNKTANRVMVVTNPLKLTITNFPEIETEWLETENNPEDESAGIRQVPFSRELWIEQEDFKIEAPNRKYFRLAPGKLVRLKSAFIIECEGYLTDEDGTVIEVLAKYFPASRSGQDNSGLKPKGTLHWVSAEHAYDCEVRLYDRLFDVEAPGQGDAPIEQELNPDSLTIISEAKAEPWLAQAPSALTFQFMRKGYFVEDIDSTNSKKVFNRTVSLKDGWKKKK